MDLTKFFESLDDPEITKYFDTLPPSPSPTLSHETEKTKWSWHENKLFENALGEYDTLNDLDTKPRVSEEIALKIPGKTVDDIKQHYKNLVEDVELIESGDIPVPNYKTTDCHDQEEVKLTTKNKSSKKIIKRKPKSWSKDEHDNFLYGLEIYGKGDWKSISRFIKTRSSTQVASHAQKYFIKLEKASSVSAASANLNANVDAQAGSLAFYPHSF